MTPRDFIVTPSAWLTDTRLNSLSDDAELMFRRLAQVTDKNWRFLFDPTDPAHSVRTAVFSPKRRFRAWNPDRIRRCLNELTAAGMLVLHSQGDRSWWEIAEPFKYVKGRDPFGIETLEQAELPIPQEPTLFALPSHPIPGIATVQARRKSALGSPPGAFAPRGGIPMRAESETDTEPESEPMIGHSTRENHSRNVSPSESGTRERGSGEESEKRERGKFARGEEDCSDPLWRELMGVVGLREMVTNGALWLKRLKLCRDGIGIGIRDWKSMMPESRAQWENPAAYMTTAYENECRRMNGQREPVAV